MKTITLLINNQEYICEQTNSLNKNDFFIQQYVGHIPQICKVIYVGSGIFQYEFLGKENHFGWATFSRMTDISKLLGKKCIMELDILYNKIIGIGFEIN